MRSLEHYRERFVFIVKFLGDLFLTIAISWYLNDRLPKLTRGTRTWLSRANGCCVTKNLHIFVWDVNGFSLKERKNVIFLNEIDLPYCLVVFFVVCPCLGPFWSAFGELTRHYSDTCQAKAVLTKPLEGTRGANGFVCRLQDAGYPRRAYFSYPTYYAIGERVHGSLDERNSKLGSRSSKR